MAQVDLKWEEKTESSSVIEVAGCRCVSNAKVYGLNDSVRRAKYPMATSIEDVTSELTKGIESLARSQHGAGHDQWLTGVVVQFDLTFSNKAWVEAERYHFLDFVSSQSTMHRMARFDIDHAYNEYVDERVIQIVKDKVSQYNEFDGDAEEKKRLYLEILYSNPAGFMLTAGLTTNYRQLKTIYAQRRNHRLPEWREFCGWIETLPMSYLITGQDSPMQGDGPVVIAISGKAGHGKDTVARLMMEELIDRLPESRVLITHYADLLKYICTALFGWNGKKDEAGRTLLQYVGTDVVRKENPNYWVDFVADMLKFFGGNWDFVIIPDARFPNEVTRLQEKGLDVCHVRVVRPEFDSGLSDKQKAHASETAMDSLLPDYVMMNSGDLMDLQDVVAKFAYGFCMRDLSVVEDHVAD